MNCLLEFIFPRRLHRLAYFFRGAMLDLVTGYVYASSTTVKALYWWPLLIVLVAYDLFFIVLPRIRDVGMNAWWLLLALVPVANVVFGIILLFRAPAILTSPPSSAGTLLDGSLATLPAVSGPNEGPPTERLISGGHHPHI